MLVDNYQNVCYLIHFDEPVNATGVQHYIGFASDLKRRISQHRLGKGARLTSKANALGIGWRVVRVWQAKEPYWESEKYLKSLGGSNLCPHCSRYMRGLPKESVSKERIQGQPSPAQ